MFVQGGEEGGIESSLVWLLSSFSMEMGKFQMAKMEDKKFQIGAERPIETSERGRERVLGNFEDNREKGGGRNEARTNRYKGRFDFGN